MKTIVPIIGIILIVGGSLLIYDGIQSKQTLTYKVKKELSTALKSISKDSRKSKTTVKNNSDTKIIGGGGVVASGIILLIISSGKLLKKNQ